MQTIATLAVTALLLLTACGGGSSTGNPNLKIEGSQQPTITFNSVLISDMIMSGGGETARASNVFCTPSGSCRTTLFGQTIQFQAEEDPRGSGTIYTTLGEWDDLRAGAVYARLEGIQGRYAFAGGIVYPNSLPQRGSATWRGDMVGLDANNRVVRGGTRLTIANLSNPRVDVLLTPQSHPSMTWNNLAVVNGGFSERRSTWDYIKGEFYGRRAVEAGGVFERNGIIGAFGADTQ